MIFESFGSRQSLHELDTTEEIGRTRHHVVNPLASAGLNPIVGSQHSRIVKVIYKISAVSGASSLQAMCSKSLLSTSYLLIWLFQQSPIGCGFSLFDLAKKGQRLPLSACKARVYVRC